MRTSVALLTTLALAGGSATALGQTAPTDPPDAKITSGRAQKDLDAARAAWKAAGIRHYTFRGQLSCFCPETYTRPRVLKVRGGLPVNPPQNLGPIASVPRMFRLIQGAIDQKVAGLTVRYGARGVPRQISIDRSRQIADEESYYTIDRFRRAVKK